MEQEKHAGGRPTKKTPDVVQKLETAAALDATVEEMSFFAGISRQTLHNWLNEDKEFFDRINGLRSKPVLAARKSVVDAINAGDVDASFKYLERKKKDEFAPRTDHVVTEGKLLAIIQDDETEGDTSNDGPAEGSSLENTESVSNQGQVGVEDDQHEVEQGADGPVSQQVEEEANTQG